MKKHKLKPKVIELLVLWRCFFLLLHPPTKGKWLRGIASFLCCLNIYIRHYDKEREETGWRLTYRNSFDNHVLTVFSTF